MKKKINEINDYLAKTKERELELKDEIEIEKR